MFRKIRKEDREFYINAVKDLYKSDAALHSIPENYIQKTFDELMKSDVYADAYIIEKDGEKAGYALLSKTFSQESGGMVVWLEEIYILPQYRSLGLGGEFIRFLKECNDFKRVRLELSNSNCRAYEAYKKYGFEIFDYKQMVYIKKEL